jgi:hypothetical protein
VTVDAAAIKVPTAPGTTLAENKDVARDIRQQQILPSLARDRAVALDFDGVEYTTQSFVHALIALPLQQHGKSALDRIEFRNCNSNVRSVILAVVSYTLRSAKLAAGE